MTIDGHSLCTSPLPLVLLPLEVPGSPDDRQVLPPSHSSMALPCRVLPEAHGVKRVQTLVGEASECPLPCAWPNREVLNRRPETLAHVPQL